MAKTSKTLNSNNGDSKKTSSKSSEIKIVVEVRFPQLERRSIPLSLQRKAINLESRGLKASLEAATATVKISPAKEIHVVEIDVNEETLLKDTDLQGGQTHMESGEVSPTKPITLYVHIVGEPNTRIDFELEFEGSQVFSSPLFIPSTGRLIYNPPII